MTRPAGPPARQGHHHHVVRWHRHLLYASGLVLIVTGAVWLGVHYTVGAGAGELPHPLEAWCLRLHGLAGFVALFVLGLLAATHIPQGWRLSERRRWTGQRRTGVWLCATAAALALSGYLLYYFAPESVRPVLGGVHAMLGALAAAVITRHRRGARRAIAPAPARVTVD